MSRKIALVACLTLVLAWSMGIDVPNAQQNAPSTTPRSAPSNGGPIKLARHPDYHAGKIAFSYMGDIWTANEDGSAVLRITDNVARDVYPRFSPDGRTIAFSSNRYGNYDVFVVPAVGGTPKRLTFYSGGDDVVGWTRDGQKILIRSSRGDGAFPSAATLYELPLAGGLEQPLPVDLGAYGDYSPDGKQLVFNRKAGSWSRKHYRGSSSADLWIADLGAKTYRQLLPDERYNRFWPMWGADNQIYFVADPLPNDKSVQPGALQVRESTNNIYKIPTTGGAPVQVTKHTSGSLFYPAMSHDGKVIVYEESFGIWKLDVASGKTTEIKIEVVTDEKENEFAVDTVQNEVDAFDLSPSGQRAVISARGQILTIATNRGDITRVMPDAMASRSQNPKWSPDGKYLAFMSDKSGRDEIWISDPEGLNPKKITDLDNEKGPILWTPDSKLALYTTADRRLYGYSVADGKTVTIATGDVGRIGNFSVSPDSKWVAFSKQDKTLRNHVYVVPITGGEARHLSDDSVQYSETSAVWTPDGRYLVFIAAETASNGIASQGGITATNSLWAVALREQDRDPMNRDIDNEAQGLAAEAAARGRGAGGGGGAAATPPTVTIDWNNLARRARQVPVPGDNLSGLVASPTTNAVVLNVGAGGGGRGGGRGGAADATSGLYIVNIDNGQTTRVPPVAEGGGGGGGGRGRGAAAPAGGGGAGAPVYTRDGRTLYFRSGTGLYAFTQQGGQGGGANAPAAAAGGGGGGRGQRGGGGAGAAPVVETGGQAPRQVTYTATIQVDRRLLRKQVFNEGWRIMKNRFYDAEMHTANWAVARTTYEPLLDYLVDQEELQSVMMMMIGELNASHTGVSGGPSDSGPSTGQTRQPGFLIKSDPSGFYRVGHIFKTGPADHDYLKISEGNYIISLDGRDLKTTDNYWQYLSLASSNKLRFMLNDKPAKDGAWEVVITPAGNFGDLQYQKWVEDRRQMVEKLSNGEIGYLHIRAMDAPSLRQFQLDLAANRTKKAMVIDQRFNGGGGIEQELLSILSGRAYQYTLGRDAGVRQPRPQNFYGPMVVMQNERSASNAEMFPAGFRALGLGKVIGVPTAGAVIGTGSYTLLDGSTIRTPGTGVWTNTGQNMENYGVPPDVLIDNTPADHLKGRDAQIEKAVEVLKQEMAAGVKK
jgi:tricorn protease